MSTSQETTQETTQETYIYSSSTPTGLKDIAKYTGNDDDITSLPIAYQCDYAFYLLSNPDPNSKQQMNEGASAIRDMSNPMNLLNMLRTPKKFGTLLTAIVFMFALITIISFAALFAYYSSTGDKVRKLILITGAPILLGIFIVIIILNLFYGRISTEVMRAYAMITQ